MTILNFLLAFLLIILSTACKNEHFRPEIKVDMSKERDAGRFLPDKGDKISIAGNFNNWKRDTLFLEDLDEDWIYVVPLIHVVKQLHARNPLSDSLSFKFIQSAGDNRELANQGWETISNHNFAIDRFYTDELILIFNEEYDDRLSADVTFTVGMSNQIVLDIFQPDEGDIIIVSGDFCGWHPLGIPMNDEDKDSIYQISSKVKYYQDESIEYKYRILSDRKTVLPNNGWESGKNRKHSIEKLGKNMSYINFNNLNRVARFVIKTKELEEKAIFSPMKGDILQIKLVLDGTDVLTDHLIRVEERIYEIAISIPPNIQEVKWQVVKNLKYPMTELKTASVGMHGKVIYN